MRHIPCELEKREDSNGDIIYRGRLNIPADITCHNGLILMVFVSEEGCEELQITAYDPAKGQKPFHMNNVNVNRFKVPIAARQDSEGKTYYKGGFSANTYLPTSTTGVDVRVFISDPERMQIQFSIPHKKES
jgi:hypothetical protein